MPDVGEQRLTKASVSHKRRSSNVIVTSLLFAAVVVVTGTTVPWPAESVATAPTVTDPSSYVSAEVTHPTTPAAAAVDPIGSTAAIGELATLPIAPAASMAGYSRSEFGPAWPTINGCDERNDTLARDLTNVTKDGPCEVTSGTLVSPYNSETIHFVRGVGTSDLVQIDHVVALGDAWRTGAQAWTMSNRESFANDPLELLAVDEHDNESKSDDDAASWLPPNTPFDCPYVALQIEIKARWHLWVTQPEHDAMVRILDGCPATPPPSSGPSDIVGMVATPSGHGYLEVGADGGVFTLGDAHFFGSMSGQHLNAPIVGMALAPGGDGYWLVGADGGIFSFGDAQYYGSTGNLHLNQPVVGMAATPDGNGYWFAAADGGIFAYGDAAFHGSMGGSTLNQPVVGMASDEVTGGYWLVAKDGGIFSFDSPFDGSTGNLRLNRPIVGMEASPGGSGYRFVASDGGVFSFNLPFGGSMGGQHLDQPVTGMAPDGVTGYWLVARDGGIFSFGGAQFYGSPALPTIEQRAAIRIG